jgi:FixJ family two-component response regulator
VANERLVVIVDDDESMRSAAVSFVRSLGFPAVAFASAEAFLSAGIIDRTSCLLLDVHMPGMGGPQLQRYLASIGRVIPIVFISGYSDESARARALAAGALCFLTKPFSEGDLLKGLLSAVGCSPAMSEGFHDECNFGH